MSNFLLRMQTFTGLRLDQKLRFTKQCFRNCGVMAQNQQTTTATKITINLEPPMEIVDNLASINMEGKWSLKSVLRGKMRFLISFDLA